MLAQAYSWTKTFVWLLLGFNLNSEAYEARRARFDQVDIVNDTRTTGEASQSWFSVFWFGWLNCIIDLGRQRPLSLCDLGKLEAHLQPQVAAQYFEEVWNKESAKPKPSFVRAIVSAYWLEYLKIAP